MSEFIEKIVLGIIQGLTEFLPVSSSGHIEIAKVLLGDDSLAQESLLTTVVLHLATALATIFVYRKDIAEILSGLFKSPISEEQRFSLNILISMIPAVFVGLLWEDLIESIFNKNLLLVGICLCFTAILLFLADRKTNKNLSVNAPKALIIGIAQAIAILPGISRSGATIATSVLLDVDKTKAARFSFLMVIPLIFGKILKDVLDGAFTQYNDNMWSLGVGFVAAFFTGIFACTLMIRLVRKSKLKYFAYYCVAVGLIVIGYSLVNS